MKSFVTALILNILPCCEENISNQNSQTVGVTKKKVTWPLFTVIEGTD